MGDFYDLHVESAVAALSRRIWSIPLAGVGCGDSPLEAETMFFFPGILDIYTILETWYQEGDHWQNLEDSRYEGCIRDILICG